MLADAAWLRSHELVEHHGALLSTRPVPWVSIIEPTAPRHAEASDSDGGGSATSEATTFLAR